MTFLDKIFCGSPKCKNKCGQQMSEDERQTLNELSQTEVVPVSYAAFCDDDSDKYIRLYYKQDNY